MWTYGPLLRVGPKKWRNELLYVAAICTVKQPFSYINVWEFFKKVKKNARKVQMHFVLFL